MDVAVASSRRIVPSANAIDGKAPRFSHCRDRRR